MNKSRPFPHTSTKQRAAKLPVKTKTPHTRSLQKHKPHTLTTTRRLPFSSSKTEEKDGKTHQETQSTSFQPYEGTIIDQGSFPVSATIDRLRKMAPSQKPTKLSEVKDVQRGNFTVPSPFEGEMVNSAQRIQQHFQMDQRQEVYPAKELHDETKKPQTNVGAIGQLEDDEEERTFSRTIFYGFGPNHVIMNGMGFQGSVVATPTMTYLWKPQTWKDVTAESMTILNFLFPQPDVILFGCGSAAKAIDPSVHHYLRTLNIPYELMSTYNAMGTFNLMNEEYRKVAAFVLTYDHNQQFEKELMGQKGKSAI